MHSKAIHRQLVNAPHFCTYLIIRNRLFWAYFVHPRACFLVLCRDEQFLGDEDTPIRKQFARSNSAPPVHSAWIPAPVHPPIHYIVEEFPILSVFHDDEDTILRLDHLVQLSNCWMSHQFENMQLACNSLDISYILYLAFFKHLYCYRFPWKDMATLLYFSECPLSDRLSVFILFYSIMYELN